MPPSPSLPTSRYGPMNCGSPGRSSSRTPLPTQRYGNCLVEPLAIGA